ncbi:MAG: ATP-binding protein [Coriobacteriales bacterium]|jgi:hypothetical protein
MLKIEDQVKKIIEELPSEASWLDYKIKPYDINENKIDFLKDIIAMLNSKADIGENKFIIIGIEDNNKYKKGIDISTWHDDNEWQNLVKKISPIPLIYSGTVDYDNKHFGYFCISKDNTDYVYEVKENIVKKSGDNKSILAGQAFVRQNTQNVVLFEDGRRKLLEKASITKLNHDDERYVSILSLIGSWNEESQGDLALIKRLLGTESNLDVKNAMTFCGNNRETFSSNNKIWQCKEHKDLLLKSTNYITATLLEKFFEEAGKVFLENGYSQNIQRGIAESIAVLGNNSKDFPNVSESFVQSEIRNLENKVFKTTDWNIYATNIADNFKYFEEAAPDIFLSHLERLFDEKDQAFFSYLEKSKPSLERHLGGALSDLAKIENYFSRSMRIIFQLAGIRESFIDILTGIVNPIQPQTYARLTIRTGVFKGLAKVNEDLTWKVLIKIINNPHPRIIRVYSTEYLDISPTENEYLESKEKYVEIACELINNQVERMCEMVEIIKYVPQNTEEYIIKKLNNNLDELSQKDREKLWNKLQDLLSWAKKRFGENIAPIEERLKPIKKLSEQLENKTGYFDNIRLFNRSWFPLLDGEWEDQEKKREIAINTIYQEGGLDSVIAFAKDIEDKRDAGCCLAKIINDEDLKAIIENNVDKNNVDKGIDELISFLVISIDFNRLAFILRDSSDQIKAKIYACLPISNQSIEKVTMLDEESAQIYWDRVLPIFVENDILLSKQAIENFNQHGRADKSIEILSRLIENKDQEIPKQMVIDTLKLFNEKGNLQHQFFVERLLSWLYLQRNNDNEITCIKKIEWKYLGYITGEEGGYPEYLQLELSKNPAFFVALVKKQNKETDRCKRKKILFLLRIWKRVPGLKKDGLIDTDYLDNWIKKVKKLAKKSNLEEQAMRCLGRILFYSPEEKSGFINRRVADILENNKDIRTGYLQEGCTFSFCGFNGVLEKELTRRITKYHSYAVQADGEGWINLAKALRNLEKFFINERNDDI